jgi:endonuclease/exonuclease/phosphatase (EEP) superfamily protein YafD
VLELARSVVVPATFVLFLLSVIAALALRPKYLELVCHFRVQYFIGAVALGLACIALAEWAGATISLASALINLPAFATLWSAQRSADGTGRRFKLMLMNVYRLNRHHRFCIECVERHRPDVVVVQELDEEWARELECLRGDYPFADVQPMNDGSDSAL